MDAGCASSIEAIESGEAHAHELAHVATHESTLGAWTLSSRHRCQGHITGSKSAEPSALSVGPNVGKRDSAVRAALGLSKRPIATALRVVGLLMSTRASIARGSDTSAANQGAMAVLAGLKGVCLASVTRST